MGRPRIVPPGNKHGIDPSFLRGLQAQYRYWHEEKTGQKIEGK